MLRSAPVTALVCILAGGCGSPWDEVADTDGAEPLDPLACFEIVEDGVTLGPIQRQTFDPEVEPPLAERLTLRNPCGGAVTLGQTLWQEESDGRSRFEIDPIGQRLPAGDSPLWVTWEPELDISDNAATWSLYIGGELVEQVELKGLIGYARLSPSVHTLDLGRPFIGCTVRGTVEVVNDGAGDYPIDSAEIRGLTSGMSLTLDPAPPLVLAPGQSATAEVTWTPQERQGHDVSASMTSNDPRLPGASFIIHGRPTPPYRQDEWRNVDTAAEGTEARLELEHPLSGTPTVLVDYAHWSRYRIDREDNAVIVYDLPLPDARVQVLYDPGCAESP